MDERGEIHSLQPSPPLPSPPGSRGHSFTPSSHWPTNATQSDCTTWYKETFLLFFLLCRIFIQSSQNDVGQLKHESRKTHKPAIEDCCKTMCFWTWRRGSSVSWNHSGLQLPSWDCSGFLLTTRYHRLYSQDHNRSFSFFLFWHQNTTGWKKDSLTSASPDLRVTSLEIIYGFGWFAQSPYKLLTRSKPIQSKQRPKTWGQVTFSSFQRRHQSHCWNPTQWN